MLLANWSRDIDRIETMDASSLKGTSTLLTLSDEHLIDVQEYVASLDNHTLHGQVFPQVFRLAHLYWKEKLRERLRRKSCHWSGNPCEKFHGPSKSPRILIARGFSSVINLVDRYLIVHLSRKILELLSRVLQTLPFHVIVWGVGEHVVQSDDVSWNLKKQ